MERTHPPASPALASANRRTLYPDNEPFATGWLAASGGHEIYYEECGGPTASRR